MEHENIYNSRKLNNKQSEQILQLEKEVELGLWIQVIGQLIEIKGLSGLLQIENGPMGEKQIFTGVLIKTIGQILEAISVSNQIGETDIIKLLQEQKQAVTGDLLVSLGSAYEALGGINVINEEAVNIPRLVT